MNNHSQDEMTKELNKVIAKACERIKDRALREEFRQALVNSARKWHYELSYSLDVHKRNLANNIVKFAPKNALYSVNINTLLTGQPTQVVEKIRPNLSYNAKGIALIDGYQESIKLALKALAVDPPISTRLRKDGKPVKVSLRNRAEMAARFVANLEDVNRFVTSGVKLVWASSHPNCSPRCKDHQGKLYSLDGTSGTTKDGVRYTPLQDVLVKNEGNSIINGYNCRHRLIEYFEGSHPPTDYTEEEINCEYQIDQRQRHYENTIRNLKAEEAVYRASGDLASAKEARLKWRMLNKSYEAYSLRNGRAYYPWRTRITLDEKEYYLKTKENKDVIVDNLKNNVIIKGVEVDIEIDEFTPCLRDKKTGKIYQTTTNEATPDDIKQTKGWKSITDKTFDWALQKKKSDKVVALKLANSDVVEGMVGITYEFELKSIHVDLVESNPKNRHRSGEFEGVGPHLFAYAIKEAIELGWNSVYFTAKTTLIEHYQKTLGARSINKEIMLIDRESFQNLYETYYGGAKVE